LCTSGRITNFYLVAKLLNSCLFRHGVIVIILTALCKVDKMKAMVLNIALAFMFGWLVLVTFIVIKLQNHYRRLIKRSGAHSIDGILDALLKEVEKGEIKAEHLEKKYKNFRLHLPICIVK